MPFGFTEENGKLIPEATEQRQLERMRKWRRQGLSYVQVAARMNELDIPMHQNAKKWYGSTVNRVLHQKHLEQFEKREEQPSCL